MINNFSPTSRYYGIEAMKIETPEGKIVVYLRRRFVPSPERFALFYEHIVTQSERLDNITAQYLGDPEQFWRVCDANGAMRPDELTERIGDACELLCRKAFPEFQMLKGIQLTLMMGPIVPIAVPRSVLDALTQVTVTTNDVGKSGFQLSFTLGTRSPLHTLFLLSGGGPIPLLRVIIVVTLNGMPNVLMDGMVTNHQIVPGGDAGHSTLTLTGKI